MRIKMADPRLTAASKARVMECLDRNWISTGPVVEEFESVLADYCGVEHCVAMNNGTSTLHAMLLALGIGPGDEVVIPDITYISTLSVVLHVGARPVIVGSDPDTFNVTAEAIASGISDFTKAIITVDMKGMPVDYDGIKDVCEQRNIPFLSDSAESLGAVYKNRKVGGQALAHSFSFFANKNLTTGEGGCVTTNSGELANELRCIRNQGQSSRYIHARLGHNFRFNDVLASIGIDQVSRLDGTLRSKERIALIYNEQINNSLNKSIVKTPFIPDYVSQHSWYNYCLKYDSVVDCQKVKDALTERNIEWRVSFPPLTLQPLLKSYGSRVLSDPVQSKSIYESMLDIPCHSGLSTADINEIVSLCMI